MVKCKYCKLPIYFANNKWRDNDPISTGDSDNHYCVATKLDGQRSPDMLHFPDKESTIQRILTRIDE